MGHIDVLHYHRVGANANVIGDGNAADDLRACPSHEIIPNTRGSFFIFVDADRNALMQKTVTPNFSFASHDDPERVSDPEPRTENIYAQFHSQFTGEPFHSLFIHFSE